VIKEFRNIELRNPVLIEGLPGLGLVGKIVVRYLIKQLKAERFAHLYSPHFPYFVLVNKKGSVRLLRGAFYFWKDDHGKNDLILLTGDSQAQTIEGQYEISECILDFAKQHGVRMIVTLGGYRMEAKEKPNVVAASSSEDLLNKALRANALVSPIGSPIVGTAGLILGLAHFKKIDALCFLGETRGYLPDPKSAESVLEVLNSFLGLRIDLGSMQEEVVKAEKMVKRLQTIEEKRISNADELKKEEGKKVTYIS
jgi:uncharacterized protein (TIGR00162 family)